MKNRKLWISLISGAMAVVMLLGLILSILPAAVSAVSSAEIQDEIDQLEKEQQGIWNEMDGLQAKQNDNWGTIEEMVAQKTNIDQQINLLNTEMLNINQQIQNYSMLIAENQVELDKAEKVLAELNEKNKERIRAMEEEGKVSFWSVVFRASSFTDLMDQLTLISEIRQADERRLQEMAEAADAVVKVRTELDAEKGKLESSR